MKIFNAPSSPVHSLHVNMISIVYTRGFKIMCLIARVGISSPTPLTYLNIKNLLSKTHFKTMVHFSSSLCSSKIHEQCETIICHNFP